MRVRIKDLAAARPSYGYQRPWLLLRRKGWKVNHELVMRLYREEGFALRKRKPRQRKNESSVPERLIDGRQLLAAGG